MDNLVYHYNTSNGRLTNNRLNYLTDSVATPLWPYSLKNQAVNNFTYDAIGNMTTDIVDTISNINWTVYNKIQSLTNSKGTLNYTYDPAGQRASKTLNGLTTYYVRDAQGNTIAVYDNAHNGINWKEQELYGSSRLGMWTPNIPLSGSTPYATWDTIGNKRYELDNHLGNVLATITDKRIQHSANGSTINYFDADASTAQEYYAFGGLMPGRTFTQSNNYRYGFNGKENDNDVKGTGNQQDYGMRIYDPRVGKFLSVDPLQKKYPDLTPYQFTNNSPIENVDLDGLEKVSQKLIFQDGRPILKTLSIGPKRLSFFEMLLNGDTERGVPLEYNISYLGQTYHFSPTYENLDNGLHPTYSIEEMKDFLKSPGKANLTSQEDADKAFQRNVKLLTVAYFASRLIESHQVLTQNSISNSIASIHSGNTEASEANLSSQKTLEVTTYQLAKKTNTNGEFNNDHIPSFASLKYAEEERLGRDLTALEERNLKLSSLTLKIKTKLHIKSSETFGGRNTKTRQIQDAANPIQAIRSNVEAYRTELNAEGYSNQEINSAIEKLSAPFKPSSNVTNSIKR